MNYKVTNSMKTREFTGRYGRTFVYTLNLENLKLENGDPEPIEISQKPETPAPKVGDEISGNIEQGKYGVRILKKDKTGGFGKNDPQTREEIIRQNSLTNAVNFCVGKANHMQAKDAVDYLTGKQIIQVATYFAKYSQGKVTVVMEPGEIAKEFGYQETEEPVNDGEMGELEQIEPSDVPF